MDAISKGKGKKSDVTRIFWPSHCTEGDSGLLVGWNVHSFTASVATVATDIPLEILHQALDIIGKSKRYSHLFFECGGAPRATGASIEACCSKIARRLVHSRRELGSLLLHQHIDTPAAFHGPLQHCSNMPHIARDLIRLRPMPTCSVEGDHADRLREILGCWVRQR